MRRTTATEVIIAPGVYTGPGNKGLDFDGLVITLRGTAPEDWGSRAGPP